MLTGMPGREVVSNLTRSLLSTLVFFFKLLQQILIGGDIELVQRPLQTQSRLFFLRVLASQVEMGPGEVQLAA